MACTCSLRAGRLGLLLGLALSTNLAWAQVPKDAPSNLDQKEFFAPELHITTAHQPLDEVLSQLPNREAWQSFRGREKGAMVPVFIDPRSGAVTNVIRSVPLIPGNGIGNHLTLQDLGARLGRSVEAVDPQVVADTVRRHLESNRSLLGIDLGQLGKIKATQINAELWQIHIPQVVNGVPVRDARLAASISHGNLVVMGTETWGNVALDTTAKVSAEKAIEAGFMYAGGRWPQDEFAREAQLEIVPVAPPQYQVGEAFGGPVGKGYQHRLVWTYVFQRGDEGARWEVMVDAHSGEVIAFQDINHYVNKQVKGGIYPLTSTEQCPDAARCGTMQTGYPMPWANTGLASPNNFTNSAGIFDYSSGAVTTTLSGKYVRVSDNCGAISESSSVGDLNLGGSNGQHDCTTAGSSAGDTPASRSAFYEVNKIAEVARGWLPSNTWLQAQLTANVNINQTCNGFWNGSTINFYRSGGGCRNTGEIAAVFDHEWGHGMDDNDANGSISVSGEAYADIASIYRLQASCVGYGFFWTSDRGCGQTADGTGFNQNEALQGAAHCNTNCSGVRDTDWAKHTDNTPDTALGFVCTSCTTGTGACGRQTHCSAAPVRQMAWDLVTRDLTAAPFNYDSQTAFTVGNKLFYHGTGNVGTWHACTCGSSASGCGATNGYMQWITADDDNGNLNDGTPHMTAIYNAYNRHGIACSTPTATNSGCASGPSAAPTVTATPGNYQVALSWTSVSGATRYWVMRGEGHGACNMAKVLVAEVTGTSYTDTQVANDRTYYYTVVAAGASSACYSRAAACVNATPTGTTTPDFSLSCSPASLTVQQGQNGTSTCTVSSTGGFNSAVSLACASLPSGVSCSYNPASVTPPANGTVNSTLTVAVSGSAATGTSTIQAQGTSGSTTRSSNLSLTVTAAPTPDFSVSCAPSSLSIQQGSSGASTCTVSSTGGFASAVSLACLNLPSGVSCGFNPASVTPPANGSGTSALTVSVSASAATGTSSFQVRGVSGSITRTFNMSLTVTGTGGGGLTAVYDATLKAPKCGTVGISCDSSTLLNGRDGKGPEPNQPNTINTSCADGTSGTYHSDESNDRIKVLTTDGSNFAPGKTVRVEATVWAWSTPSSDKLDLYYAANASSPTWTLIGTLTPTVAGAQTLSATYSLPTGALQAVRARFRYGGSAAACGTGSYNDHDDLVFAVDSGSTPPDVTAAYDATLKAPKCSTVGKSCESGTLLNGRDGKGPEPNQPNTINTSCADGTSGTYHSDESNDKLKVLTTDGSALAAGKTVRVEATVWAYSSYTSDHLDLYYTATAASPSWTFIGTLTPTGSGTRVLSATYTLPAGTLQAVRARFRYNGSAGACTTGSYDDHDDLVFAVE